MFASQFDLFAVRKFVQEAFQIYDKHLGDQTISARSFGTVDEDIVVLAKNICAYFVNFCLRFNSCYGLISQVARALGHNPTRAELSELLVGKTQDDTFTLAEVSAPHTHATTIFPRCYTRIRCSQVYLMDDMQWTVL